MREEEKKDVIYIGDKTHPEVKAVLSYGKKIPVIETLEDLVNSDLDKDKEYSFVVQKTYDNNKFDAIKQYAKKTFKNVSFKDDLCGATYERQEAIARMAKEVDVVVVIGGRMSSNTQKMYKISKELNKASFLIEEPEELNKEWFEGVSTIGISAGASTPDYLIDETEDRIKSFF